jgi:hypothetical protein
MFRTKLFALALLGVSLAPAQLMRVMVADVKPDRVAEFIELQKQATAAYQKAGHAYRSVYGPGGLGEQSTWTAFTPLASYAEFDTPVAPKMMGEGAYQEFLGRARHTLNSVRYEVVERRPDITIDEGPRPAGLYSVVHVQVKVGHEAAFEAKYKAVTEAVKKMGQKTLLVSRVVFGGEIGHYRIGAPLANYGEMDKGGLALRAMGKEAYDKFRASVADDIISVRYEIVKLSPELSFQK